MPGKQRHAKPQVELQLITSKPRRSRDLRVAPEPAPQKGPQGQKRRRPGQARMSAKEASHLVKTHVPKLSPFKSQALGQFADPVTYHPTRLPDVTSLSSVGTAIAPLVIVESLHWPTTTLPVSGLPVLPDGAIVGDPLARLVCLLRDPVVTAVVQDSTFSTSTTDCVMRWPSPVNIAWAADVPYDVEITHGEFVSGPERYGTWQPVAHNGNWQGLWVDSNPTSPTHLYFNFTTTHEGSYGGRQFKVLWYCFTSDGEREQVGSCLFNMGNGVYNVGPFDAQYSGYYCAELSLIGENNFTNEQIKFREVSLTSYTSLPLVHRHVVHPDISGSDGRIVEDVRVLGSAFLATNVTAKFFKGGTVFAQQVTQTNVWYDGCESAAQIMANNAALTYDGPLDKGLYCFVKPQGENALSLRPCVDLIEHDADEVTMSYVHYLFHPFRVPGTVQVLFSPLDPTGADIGSACNLTVHFTRSIEFTSSLQLVLLDHTSLPREALLSLLDSLDHIGQFYENPLHWADIKRALAKAGKWSWENKAMLAQVAAAIGKAVM